MNVHESIMTILGDADESIVSVLENMMESRLLLRLEVQELPDVFSPILVDATCKAYRRVYFEGIKSENVGGLSVSFADDMLSEYDREISAYKNQYGVKVVRFL